MKKLLMCSGLLLLSVLITASYLQSGEVSDIQLMGGKEVSFYEAHDWPGSRCDICHVSSSPGAESALLNNPDHSLLCESCHKGTVTILTSFRLKSEFKKMDNHPIKFSPLDFDEKKINHNIIKEKNQF